MGQVARRVLCAIVAVAIALRLAIAWQPVGWLTRTVLGDDPFYYFTIARHVVAGHGVTFDGVEPTNGFHPLWMIAILPVFALVSDAARAIHVALTLSAAFDVVALLMLQRLLREAGAGAVVSLAAAALYAVSPLLLSPSGALNGMETALNLALTFAFLMQYRRRFVCAGATRGPGGAIALGVCSGLLFLARSDNAILLLLCHGQLAWRARRFRAGVGRAAGAALIAGGVATPWLLWSRVTFGSFVQVSGLSVAHVTRTLAHVADWTLGARAIGLARNLATVATYLPVYHFNVGSFAAAAAGNVLVLLAVTSAVVATLRADTPAARRALSDRLAPWIAPLVAAAVFVVVHTIRAVELRGWYYVSTLPAAYVVLALAADYGITGLGTGARRVARPLLAASLGVALAAMLVLSLRAAVRDRCGEGDGYQMVQELNRALPQGTRLGSWNAGLFGYFYRRGDVVNLDGLVNNGAYRSILDRSLGAYVARRDIAYLIDAPGAMELWKPFWDHGRPVVFGPAVLDNRAVARCRPMSLVAVPRPVVDPRAIP